MWYHTEPSIIAYNRNEGLRFAPFYWNWNRDKQSRIRLSFSFGYRFGSKEFIGRTTMEAVLFNKQHVTLFTSGFKISQTDDKWRLPESENSWAGLLGRQDFYDRWDETGSEAGVSLILGGWEMSEGIIFRGRSILGRSSEAVPAYRMFGVGGLGSVGGHRYKIQSGSTMEQVNLELVFTEEFTQKGFLFKIFYDGGRAYSPSTQPAEMLQGAGFGFGTSKKDGLGIGFNVARALDGKNPVESTVRFNYNF